MKINFNKHESCVFFFSHFAPNDIWHSVFLPLLTLIEKARLLELNKNIFSNLRKPIANKINLNKHESCFLLVFHILTPTIYPSTFFWLVWLKTIRLNCLNWKKFFYSTTLKPVATKANKNKHKSCFFFSFTFWPQRYFSRRLFESLDSSWQDPAAWI